MILLDFSWENIFSLSKGRCDLADRGLCLVTGENQDEGGGNGAGKSSFASKGIMWTLYGQTPGGIKADDVINRHTKKKSGWGSVTFMSNGDEYTVKRYRPAKLRLWKGPDEITAKKVTTTQEMIDQALGRDFKTFLQTEMFGQGRTLSYAALGAAEQKRVLEQILPIQTLDEWAEEAKDKAGKVKVLLDKANVAVEVESSKLATLQRQYENMKQTMNDWTERNEQAIINKRHELDKYSGQIRKAKSRIEQIDTNLGQIIRPAPIEVAEMRKKIEAAKLDTDAGTLQYTEAQNVYQQWRGRFIHLQGSLPVKIEALNCPTCNRPWDEEFVNKHNEKYDQHFMSMKEAEVTAKHAEEVAETYHHHMLGLDIRCMELKNRLQEMEQEEKKFTDLMMERHKQETFLSGEPTSIKLEIDTLMMGTNPHRDTVDDLSKDLKTQRAEVTKVKINAETFEQEHKDLLYWQKAYSKDIKVKLFAAACPYLDQAATEHLKALNNERLHVQFSTVKILSTGDTKEDFNVRCWNDTGGEGFDSLSGGEQQMVSFAIGRALADLARTQTSGASEFQIMDEPFSMLDERNSEAIVNYLKNEVTKGTILLISNEDHLKGLITNRITVIKKNGISEVKDG